MSTADNDEHSRMMAAIVLKNFISNKNKVSDPRND